MQVRAHHSLVFTAYGAFHRACLYEQHLAAFKGYAWHALTQTYVLGHGYRHYSAALMRFTAADRLSPFAQGGLNAYAYCNNDPINFTDPNGAMKRPNILINKKSKNLTLRRLPRIRPRPTASPRSVPPEHLPRPGTSGQNTSARPARPSPSPSQPMAASGSSLPTQPQSNASALIEAAWNKLSPEARSFAKIGEYAQAHHMSLDEAFSALFPIGGYPDQQSLKHQIAHELGPYRNFVQLIREPKPQPGSSQLPFGYWITKPAPQ